MEQADIRSSVNIMNVRVGHDIYYECVNARVIGKEVVTSKQKDSNIFERNDQISSYSNNKCFR